MQAQNTRQFWHPFIAGIGHKGGDVELHILAFLSEERQCQAVERPPHPLVTEENRLRPECLASIQVEGAWTMLGMQKRYKPSVSTMACVV